MRYSRAERRSQVTTVEYNHPPHFAYKHSPTLYVGYVEDEESIDAIMKKFEELERIQTDQNVALDEEQLRQVFIRTSAFTVESALLVNEGIALDYDDDCIVQEQLGLEEDELMSESDGETIMSDEEKPTFTKRQKPLRRVNMATRKKSDTPGPRVIRLRERLLRTVRTKKASDPDATIVLKLPEIIPRSWALLIDCPLEASKETPHAIKRDLLELGSDWLGVLMDPPFSEKFRPHFEFAQLKGLRSLSCGMLFIWCESEWLADIVEVISTWGFDYVENAVWIQKDLNCRISCTGGHLFGRSHSTLLIFRKPSDPQTIRHQRNPDCIFDFIKPAGSTYGKPKAAIELIEDMLPDAVSSQRLLYLYKSMSGETNLLGGLHRDSAEKIGL